MPRSSKRRDSGRASVRVAILDTRSTGRPAVRYALRRHDRMRPPAFVRTISASSVSIRISSSFSAATAGGAPGEGRGGLFGGAAGGAGDADGPPGVAGAAAGAGGGGGKRRRDRSVQPIRIRAESTTKATNLFSMGIGGPQARGARSASRTGGTGSKPPALQGWQRRRRQAASRPPRARPCRSTASAAYAEHVGLERD